MFDLGEDHWLWQGQQYTRDSGQDLAHVLHSNPG